MKKHTLRFRAVDRATFADIRDGRKRVETRAATVKYRNIAPADLIAFVCGQDRFERTVATVEHFASVDDLLMKHAVKDINASAATPEDLKMMYDSFPGYPEKIAQFGLVALTLEP